MRPDPSVLSPGVRVARRSFLGGVLLLSLFLAACGVPNQHAYHQALEQLESLPEPAYYRHEINRPVEAVAEADEPPPWIEEREPLAAMQPPQRAFKPAFLDDFDAPQSLMDRQLASSPAEMDARLAESPNLDLLLSLAYERNQGLQAAQRTVEAALEQYPQAIYLDNVLSQYNAFTKQLDTKIGKPRHKEMVGMQFPSPDMLALKGSLITQEVSILQADVAIALRDLVTEVRLAYYESLFVQESLDITREQQDLLGLMLQIATAKFGASLGNYQSILKAQVALSKLSDSMLTLEERQTTLTARINTLLNRLPDAPLGAPTALPHEAVTLPLQELYALGMTHRQEIQKQQLIVGKMEQMIEMVQRLSTPDASLGASYFEPRTGIRSGTDTVPKTFMNQRTVNPTTAAWFAKDAAYTRELAAKADAMRQRITDMQDKTRFLIKLHHFGASTARRTVKLYDDTLIPQAQQALDAANTAYQADKVDFLNFLDAQRTLIQFRLARQKALWEDRMHTAQLEQSVGKRLPKQPLEWTHPMLENERNAK